MDVGTCNVDFSPGKGVHRVGYECNIRIVWGKEWPLILFGRTLYHPVNTRIIKPVS